MNTLLLTLIAAVGASHIIVDGSIFARFRGLLIETYKDTRPWVLELITCYQCTGFWAGVLLSLLLQPISWDLPWFLALPLYLVVTPFAIGSAASYLSMAGAALLNYLDAPAMMASAMKKNDSKT